MGAETVQLDGGLLLLLLIFVLLFVAFLVAVVVFGFVWAARAGRGSQAALAGWIVTLVIEGLLAAQAIFAAIQRLRLSPFPLTVAAIIAGQAVVFSQARRRS